jgi:hypothetical protein
MMTLLERAVALLKDLDEHEGAEGWSADTRRRLDTFMQEYTIIATSRLRTLPAVYWVRALVEEIPGELVEVANWQYRWSEGIAEGWGNASLYLHEESMTFYKKFQQGHIGHGKLAWLKGSFQG